MIERIDPRLLYPDNAFFLDYVDDRRSAVGRFEYSPALLEAAADARRSIAIPRELLVSRLRAYNAPLVASPATSAHLDALARPESLCVLGGQQVGFLGGPLFTAYKALSVVRVASRLADRLGTPVVPIFWLASEDHDFTEINRIRTLDPAGDLRTIAFDWDGRGRPIERLAITDAVLAALSDAMELLPERSPARGLFAPDPSDDYATWHARIWARLFAEDGLILVEPRTVRPLAGPFFAEVLAAAGPIAGALRRAAEELDAHGYSVPLDPDRAGGLFTFSADGRRVRIADPAAHAARAAATPTDYSPDAALRPLLADSLFPTVASVLGPGEIAYQAMLGPLYRLLSLPQPVALARPGYTLLSASQAELLERCGRSVADVLSGGLDPASVAQASASPQLLRRFDEQRAAVIAALEPLRGPVEDLDPGLAARWRQTADRIDQQLSQLEERAVRADLARAGISVRALRTLDTALRPTGRPQERVLSLLHAVAGHGLGWIRTLEYPADPGEYAHYAVTLGESNA